VVRTNSDSIILFSQLKLSKPISFKMSWLRLMEQNIKQNESSEVELPLDEAGNKPHIKKNKVINLIKEMWPAYLIEIMVIILGISITLALEKWRDNVKEDQLETIYEKNLLINLETDRRSLDYAIRNTQQILDKGKELHNSLRNQPSNKIIFNEISADVRLILGRPKFTSSDATFSDLKSSGNIHLLKDIQLKNSLFAYYGVSQNIKELQDAEQLATINISGPYFIKLFPLEDSAGQSANTPSKNLIDLPNSVEFRNNVLLRVHNREELLIEYKNADSLSIILTNQLLSKTKD
jgi:hypothetical protein